MCISQTTIIIACASLAQQAHFEPIHDTLNFNEPVQVLCSDTNEQEMYVVEKEGVVRRTTFKKEEINKPVFLNIKDRVNTSHSEEGLLSMAFHPNYKENNLFFVWYTAHNPRRCVLSRFESANKTGDPNTEEVILEVAQPWGNHNGGTVLFGGDGYLYLGIGDGGGSNDTKENGQNKQTLLGSIIRIDIDKPSGKKKYSIPTDNPFVGEKNARGEIWALGLRNPWRMSFDKDTGKLWVADVGQNRWEEIDIVEKGKNYGWNIREGKHRFMQNESDAQLTEPVFEYGRSRGGSITGGHVYRGGNIPRRRGQYIYSDYLSGRTWWLLPPKENEKEYSSEKITTVPPLPISSFGETIGGEILACGFKSPYATKGKIYRLVPSEPAPDSSLSTDNTW